MAIFVMSTRSSPGDILPSKSNASQRRDWVQFVRERVKWSGDIGSAGDVPGRRPELGFRQSAFGVLPDCSRGANGPFYFDNLSLMTVARDIGTD
jgi:hypothetical protein